MLAAFQVAGFAGLPILHVPPRLTSCFDNILCLASDRKKMHVVETQCEVVVEDDVGREGGGRENLSDSSANLSDLSGGENLFDLSANSRLGGGRGCRP